MDEGAKSMQNRSQSIEKPKNACETNIKNPAILRFRALPCESLLWIYFPPIN